MNHAGGREAQAAGAFGKMRRRRRTGFGHGMLWRRSRDRDARHRVHPARVFEATGKR
jgi:hypothetical protein